MSAVRQLREPSFSLEAEQSVIGAVLYSPKAWARIANLVSADDFFRQDHRQLWLAIGNVIANGSAVDAVSVTEQIERTGKLEICGGRDYLAGLVRDTPSAANVETYAGLVRDHAVKRRVGTLGDQVARLGYGDLTGEQAMLEASRLFGELHGSAIVGRGMVEARILVAELLDDLDRRRAGECGLSVGLPDFDRASFGLDPGDLVVLAGRPGMGKTALLVSIAASVSRDTPVAVFSAEMPSMQMMRRCVAALSGLPQSRMRQPDQLQPADWERLAETAGQVSGRRLWVDDTAAPTLAHVRGEVLALQTRSPLGLVMIDYVQLVQGEGGNRYEQLRDVAYGLKALAKESQVPIVLLAQLNRSVDGRDNKRPRIADLRDSGAIEEAADIVGLLYSEGYYDPEFAMPNVLECAIEKNRNGERGLCYWHFSGDLSRVGVLEPHAAAQYRTLLAHRKKRHEDDL